MKNIPFGKFFPKSTNINILPFEFVINTPIIDNLHNKNSFENLKMWIYYILMMEYISVTTLFAVF